MIQAGRTAKGEQTRAAIFEAALDLFRAQGYDATTMRAIAQRAGVSLGSSYHYFRSKEHLVLEFYRYLHSLHREAVAPVLAREKGLVPRLRGVIRAIVPYILTFLKRMDRSSAEPANLAGYQHAL